CVVLVAGSVFVALGYVSTAVETALVHLAATDDLTAIRVLFELQARIPVVFAAAAFTAATAIAGGKARLLPRPVAVAGLALAALFAAGAVLSLVGPVAGDASPIGPALLRAWMLTLSIGVHCYERIPAWPDPEASHRCASALPRGGEQRHGAAREHIARVSTKRPCGRAFRVPCTSRRRPLSRGCRS
ncbi:MAG TPA: hypothetical protein VNA11_21260, partial [Pseudonocardia sp.]|nr:hypothetical protein [Pseudonocardia sp.]